MSGEGERRERIVAEAAQQLAVLQQTAEQIVEMANMAAGEPVLVRRQPSVLDAHFSDLAAMEQQTSHFAEAMRLIKQWLSPGDQRSLGSILKVMPADVAHEITKHLHGAGLLPERSGL